jgi:hypothetical protein
MIAPNTMSMFMSTSNLTVFYLMLQIYKIKMTKKMVFVSRVRSSSFFVFSFSMNHLVLNDVTLILGVDMDVDVSIETHMKYDKLLILKKKMTGRPI